MTESKFTLLRQIVLIGSTVLLLLGLFWIARAFIVDGTLRFGNPVGSLELAGAASSESEAQPRRVRAEVTRVRGAQVVRPGDKCDFLVERRPLENGAFYCNAQIVCGGQLLYGGPDRGYFACALYDAPRRDVVGTDANTSSEDHDPALNLDTQAGVLRVWDDERGALREFEVEAEVLDVN